MNQIFTAATMGLPEIGAPFEGGFLGGVYYPEGRPTAIIMAPKAEGEFTGQWGKYGKDVPGACSLTDSLSNTLAMAEAGSSIAKKVLGLKIGGFTDWRVPALEKLGVCRANLFPRAGIVPAQTIAEAFREGGSEAFDLTAYWSSTQHSPGYAWLQGFSYGDQYNYDKDGRGRVRAVRECPL